MTTKTINEILKDENFISSLSVKNCDLFFIYRGGSNVEYHLFVNNQLLFSGDTYKPSPLYSGIESLESMCGCLSFLTLQEGAVESEYFKDYTDAQLLFRDGLECEEINSLLNDFEDKESEYCLESFEILHSGYNIKRIVYDITFYDKNEEEIDSTQVDENDDELIWGLFREFGHVRDAETTYIVTEEISND